VWVVGRGLRIRTLIRYLDSLPWLVTLARSLGEDGDRDCLCRWR